MPNDHVADAIRDTLISPNEYDRNLETANAVDGLFAISRALDGVRESITPKGASPTTDAHGGQVGSLTEAMLSIANSLERIASAVDAVAELSPFKR